MASIPPNLLICTIVINLFLLLSATATTTTYPTSTVSLSELDSAIAALHRHDFNLFGNSLAVTDLSFRVLTSSNGDGFTFLAPSNSALFSLDMSTDAFTYIHSLRFHLIPRRLSYSDLRDISLTSSPYLNTLAGGHNLFVASSGETVSVDGVRVSVPDLFLRSKIAIHGLDGILVTGTEEFFEGNVRSISTPPAVALSPASEGIPAMSPMVLTPEGSVWYNLDEEVVYPNIWPPIGSISLSATTDLTHKAWEESDPAKNHVELQVVDEDDVRTDWATYEHSSFL